MRSRSCCAISGVLVLLGSLACDAPAERRESKEAKADFKKEVPDRYRADEILTDIALGSTAEPEEDPAPAGCPSGMEMLGDGSCTHEENFNREQEALDSQVLAEIQAADTAQAQVKAQEHFIESQARQIDKAEEDLDEIIRDLKRKKRAEKELND